MDKINILKWWLKWLLKIIHRIRKERPSIEALRKISIKEIHKIEKKIMIIDTNNKIAFMQNKISEAWFKNIERINNLEKLNFKRIDVILYSYDWKENTKIILEAIKKQRKTIPMITYSQERVTDELLNKFEKENRHTFCNNTVNAVSYVDFLASLNC